MALDLEASLVQTTGINTAIVTAIHTIMAMATATVVMQIQKAKSIISIKKPPYLGGFFYAIFFKKTLRVETL